MSSYPREPLLKGIVYGSSITVEQTVYELLLHGGWASTPIADGSTVNIANGVIHGTQFIVDNAAYLCVAPDTVLDVTELTSVFHDTDTDALAYIGKLFSERTTTKPMLRGAVINAAFDTVARYPHLSDADIAERAVHTRPVALASLLSTDPDLEEHLFAQVIDVLGNMRNTLKAWDNSRISLEVVNISPEWGLQGRFDVVVDKGERYSLVELKSGKPRQSPQHMAQLALYGLMASTSDPTSIYDMQLWYPANSSILVDLVDAGRLQRKMLRLRNHVIHNLRLLSTTPEVLLRQLSQENLQGLYQSDAYPIQHFAHKALEADQITKNLITSYIGFAANEQQVVRDGLSTQVNRSISNLWKTPLYEKQGDATVLPGLRYDAQRSDAEQMHLVFHRQEGDTVRSIRPGDMVIAYPNLDGRPAHRNPLFKGSVTALSARHVEISLRNKQADVDKYVSFGWTAELDVSDSGIRHLYASVRTFALAPARRRSLLAGLKRPSFSAQRSDGIVLPADLTPEQESVVRTALQADDIFLIQGPPGTGKTSSVLRGIVAGLMVDPNERVLLLAYTNRAADEICDVLERKLPDVTFLRHGSKEGSRHRTRSIPHLALTLPAAELASRIESCRCVVATITSMHTSPEVMAFGAFTTAIIDEASQVLEPQIMGILAVVQRAILIGDHCQLPAIVTQPADLLSIADDEGNRISFRNLGISLFERLATHYRRCGWNEAFRMLTVQGRMHQDVMRFPSLAFYGNELRPMLPWQTDDTPTAWSGLVASRAAFIAVDERQAREGDDARLAVHLAMSILEASAAPPSVGIISPFRSKNNVILGLLPESAHHHITVDTVERYQGSERDVIIYVTAATSLTEFEAMRSESAVNGIMIDRKFNVALTRARHQIIVIGIPDILRASTSYAQYMKISSWCVVPPAVASI